MLSTSRSKRVASHTLSLLAPEGRSIITQCLSGAGLAGRVVEGCPWLSILLEGNTRRLELLPPEGEQSIVSFQSMVPLGDTECRDLVQLAMILDASLQETLHPELLVLTGLYELLMAAGRLRA